MYKSLLVAVEVKFEMLIDQVKLRKLIIWMIVLLSALVCPGCIEKDLPGYEDLLGFYSWSNSVTNHSIYGNSDEAPLYFLDKNAFFLYSRDYAHYSPYSSNGTIYGNQLEYVAEWRPIDVDESIFAKQGIDISSFKSCRRFILVDGLYDLYQMDDELWLAEQWREDKLVIMQLQKENCYELIPVEDMGEKVWRIRDVSAPSVLDVTDSKLTKEDIENFIGNSVEKSRIVAHQDGVDDSILGGPFEEYRILEYCNGKLRSWVRYMFWTKDIYYGGVRGSLYGDCLGIHNDSLFMTCEIYSYETDLQEKYKNLSYEEILIALQDNGYRIV